jgi:hypothetical protein
MPAYFLNSSGTMMYPIHPPEEVKFLDVKVEPWADGLRVKVLIQLTPFLKPPNLEVRVENNQGEQVARVDIIETNTSRLVFTIHLRGQQAGGQYTLFSRLYYPELESEDTNQLVFQV